MTLTDTIHHAVTTAPQPITANQIATDLGLHPRTAYRHLARLERAGLVHRFNLGHNKVVWYPDGTPAPARHSKRTCGLCRSMVENRSRYGDPLGITPPGNPRLPWAPVAAELIRINGGPVSDHRAQQLLGHHHDMIGRWRHIGVELHTADQIAATLGHHPADLWGDEYWTIGFRVCPTIGEPEEAAA